MSKDYATASWHAVNDLQEKLHNLAMLREELPESVPHLDEDIEQLYGQLVMMTNCAEETITKAKYAAHTANEPEFCPEADYYNRVEVCRTR